MRWPIRSQLLLPVVLLLVGVARISVTTALAFACRARQQNEPRLRDVALGVRNGATGLGKYGGHQLNVPILQQVRSLSGAEFLHLPWNEKAARFEEPRTSLQEADPAEVLRALLDEPLSEDPQSLRLGRPVRV